MESSSYSNCMATNVVYPQGVVQLRMKIQGVYGAPQVWKTTDQANVGLFTYTARFFKCNFEKGKIHARQLTERELREQEEKNKKGGKKEVKKDEGNLEEERQRKRQEEEEKKKEEELEKFTEEERNFRIFQDPYKHHQLRFEANQCVRQLAGKELVVFEERVIADHGEWIYLYRHPAVAEEELAKLKKTKPKTLANVNDLNPVCMRAWVDLGNLDSQTVTHITVRCRLTQVDKNGETSQPNLQKTYIKLHVQLSQPLQIVNDGLVSTALIVDPPQIEEIPAKTKCVDEFRTQLKLAIQSLAMEYFSMFSRQLGILQQLKSNQFFINKRNDISKRKEQFLYDFNVSGKYKILKDRMKKVIVHLCEHKYKDALNGAKSFTGITCTLRDQFYSEIYVFLVTTYKETLRELVFEKENLREVQVLSQSVRLKNVQNYLQTYHEESEAEQLSRVVEEYEMVFDYAYGEQVYRAYLALHSDSPQITYHYALYCLRNQLKTPEQVLPLVQLYLSHDKTNEEVRMKYLLLLLAGFGGSAKVWVLLREAIQKHPEDLKLLMLASFLFENEGRTQLASKYFHLAERIYLRKEGKIPQLGRHRQACSNEIPTLKAEATYADMLSFAACDQLWLTLVELLSSCNLSALISKLQPKIKQQTGGIFRILALKTMLREGQSEQFAGKAEHIYKQFDNQEILELIIRHQTAIEGDQLEHYLKIAVSKARNTAEKRNALLRLSYFYLRHSRYGNAKACLTKYLEKGSVTSGLSWRMLGECSLSLGDLENSEQCFRHANLLDPGNADTWLDLAKLFGRKRDAAKCNQSLNQYEFLSNGRKATEIYRQIANSFGNQKLEEYDARNGQCQLYTSLMDRLIVAD